MKELFAAVTLVLALNAHASSFGDARLSAHATDADPLSAVAQTEDAGDEVEDAPRTIVHHALEARAELPDLEPTLPAQASDRARWVHANLAFGKHGAAQKLAHDQGSTDAVKTDHRGRGVEVAIDAAMKSANGELHSAAGHVRAEAAHQRNSAHAQSQTNGNANATAGGKGHQKP
jgi:hypothetical protein